jgi:hypothetical protein
VENSASNLKFDWQRMLHEALVEVNPEKLRAKVAQAEAAIFERLQTMGQDSSDSEERNALRDASNSLLTLKREVLKFPDWRPE